ncbi:hypothetical protein ScPMuIL_018408 [Solemya velum]
MLRVCGDTTSSFYVSNDSDGSSGLANAIFQTSGDSNGSAESGYVEVKNIRKTSNTPQSGAGQNNSVQGGDDRGTISESRDSNGSAESGYVEVKNIRKTSNTPQSGAGQNNSVQGGDDRRTISESRDSNGSAESGYVEVKNIRDSNGSAESGYAKVENIGETVNTRQSGTVQNRRAQGGGDDWWTTSVARVTVNTPQRGAVQNRRAKGGGDHLSHCGPRSRQHCMRRLPIIVILLLAIGGIVTMGIIFSVDKDYELQFSTEAYTDLSEQGQSQSKLTFSTPFDCATNSGSLSVKGVTGQSTSRIPQAKTSCYSSHSSDGGHLGCTVITSSDVLDLFTAIAIGTDGVNEKEKEQTIEISTFKKDACPNKVSWKAGYNESVLFCGIQSTASQILVEISQLAIDNTFFHLASYYIDTGTVVYGSQRMDFHLRVTANDDLLMLKLSVTCVNKSYAGNYIIALGNDRRVITVGVKDLPPAPSVTTSDIPKEGHTLTFTCQALTECDNCSLILEQGGHQIAESVTRIGHHKILEYTATASRDMNGTTFLCKYVSNTCLLSKSEELVVFLEKEISNSPSIWISKGMIEGHPFAVTCTVPTLDNGVGQLNMLYDGAPMNESVAQSVTPYYQMLVYSGIGSAENNGSIISCRNVDSDGLVINSIDLLFQVVPDPRLHPHFMRCNTASGAGGFKQRTGEK